MRRALKTVMLLLTALAALSIYALYPPTVKALTFPGGKRFAFSIVDDTDMATLERVEPIYQLLEKYGLRTTKTVWVFPTNDGSHSPNRGDSLSDSAYYEFIASLQRKGFEIALHGVRGGSAIRDEVADGLDEFKRKLGAYPRMHTNHSLNLDNLYWGQHRFSIPPYRWLIGFVMPREFAGHKPGTPYFWGDLAQRHIRYVGQFTFHEINLLKVEPSLPCRIADKPYVNYWFPTSHGDNLDGLVELLKPENLDRLVAEGGVSLVYAHLGAGSFNRNGGVDARFEERIKDLASRDGWFAPASDILDYLTRQPGWSGERSLRDAVRLETRFAAAQLRSGVR
jgi:hypothetical protein